MSYLHIRGSAFLLLFYIKVLELANQSSRVKGYEAGGEEAPPGKGMSRCDFPFPLPSPVFSIIPACCAEQAVDSCALDRWEWLSNLFTDIWILYFSTICCGVEAICGVYVIFTHRYINNWFWQGFCLGCYYYCQSKDLALTRRLLHSISLWLQLIYAAV